MGSPNPDNPAAAKAHGSLAEAGAFAPVPEPNLINLKLLAAFDQLPEPHVPKVSGAVRLGVLAIAPCVLWVMIFGLLRAM